jgi:hypothetical protein
VSNPLHWWLSHDTDDKDQDGYQNFFYGHQMWLIARKDFIEFSHCESYKSYNILFLHHGQTDF